MAFRINFSKIFFGKDSVKESPSEGTERTASKRNVYRMSPYINAPSLYWNNDIDEKLSFNCDTYSCSIPKEFQYTPFKLLDKKDFADLYDKYVKNKTKSTLQITDINKVGEYGEKNKISEKTLPDGTVILTHSFSRLEKCQPEWLDLQKYMVQAANELGLTLVYSDVCRTVAQSNKSRAAKGTHVAKGKDSPHNYGVAADIILLKDGKRINEKPKGNEPDLQAQFADRVSELSGGKIAWGGDKEYYPNLYKKERHHFELRDWNVKGNENFCKTPDRLIKTYA